jgi:hypothetical protein
MLSFLDVFRHKLKHPSWYKFFIKRYKNTRGFHTHVDNDFPSVTRISPSRRLATWPVLVRCSMFLFLQSVTKCSGSTESCSHAETTRGDRMNYEPLNELAGTYNTKCSRHPSMLISIYSNTKFHFSTWTVAEAHFLTLNVESFKPWNLGSVYFAPIRPIPSGLCWLRQHMASLLHISIATSAVNFKIFYHYYKRWSCKSSVNYWISFFNEF